MNDENRFFMDLERRLLQLELRIGQLENGQLDVNPQDNVKRTN